MPEDDTTPTPTPTEPAPADDDTGDGKPTPAPESPDDAAVAAADKPDAVKNAIRRHQDEARKERKRAEAAEQKAQEYEDRDKTAQEKADAKAAEAEKKAAKAEAKLLRMEVAGDKELPISLASRLQGETKEELEADADELLKQVRPQEVTDFDSGPRTSSNKTDMDSMIRRAAGRGQ